MNTPNNLEWVDEVLETMACTDCSGYPIDEHAKAKQTIATKLAEAYRQGYRDGTVNRIVINPVKE